MNGVRLNGRNRGGICERREIPQSGMVISDVKQGKNWTERDHRRNLKTNRRQESKKFLIAMIKSKETERPKSVLESMFELAEIVPESFARC